MVMSRARKEEEIKLLNRRFEESELVVVTHYSGLNVEEISELRSQLRKEGASFRVSKNTLSRIAVKGTRFEHMKDMFSGPTGIAVSPDPVSAAKVTHKFAKKNDKLVIIGGSLAGEEMDVEGIKKLASLPGMDELRGKLCGLLKAPASRLAAVLQTPARKMVGVTKAYGEKGE